MEAHRVGTRTTATSVRAGERHAAGNLQAGERHAPADPGAGAAGSKAEVASARRPTIAVLAVQGAFIEHERRLARLGADVFELRQAADLARPFDALVLPGGESTTQGKLLRELDMLEPLRERIAAGMPTLGTCAGMILLADQVEGGGGPYFGTMPIVVRRNAYGRQLESFHAHAEVAGVGRVPMTFIRAPYVERVGAGAEVLARVNGDIVAVQAGAQIALAFHPELDPDDTIHQAFLDMAKESAAS